MPIRVTQIGVGGFDENCSYLIHDLESKHGFVVDPAGSFERVIHAAHALAIDVTGIILTHSHSDHFDALHQAVESFPRATIYIHEYGRLRIPFDTSALVDGQSLLLGNGCMTVLHTPGHTEDSICLFVAAAENCPPQLVSGDTLFVGGCGRIPADAAATMYASLQRLKALPSETIVYPGHDYGETPTDTLGHQLIVNRFLTADSLSTFTERRLGANAVQ